MRMRRQPGVRRAFTLIGLLVVAAIIAVLIAILAPSLGRARQQAYQIKCAANLKSIGLGIFYYVDDQHGFLPILGGDHSAFWVPQLLPYVPIKRSKLDTRSGLLTCPADDDPWYVYVSGPSAGWWTTKDDKSRSDTGQSQASGGARRRGGGSAGAPGMRTPGPLIEPLTYVGSDANYTRLDVHGRNLAERAKPRKLAEFDRPYCHVLLSEFSFGHLEIEWGFHQSLHITRHARRHYGGMNLNSNGTNWLFADLHVQWRSAASLEKLFCCQDFPRGSYLYEGLAQMCGGGGGGQQQQSGETRRR